MRHICTHHIYIKINRKRCTINLKAFVVNDKYYRVSSNIIDVILKEGCDNA